MVVVIPGEFASLNEFIDANRRRHGSWSAGNQMKQRDQNILIAEIKRQIRRNLRYPIKLEYLFICSSKRRDKDNVSGYFRKVFQDALVKSGRLPDDGWDYIDSSSEKFEIDKGNPRIVVTIREARRQRQS